MSETSKLREQSEARSSDGHGHRTTLVMPQSTLHLVLYRRIACARPHKPEVLWSRKPCKGLPPISQSEIVVQANARALECKHCLSDFTGDYYFAPVWFEEAAGSPKATV